MVRLVPVGLAVAIGWVGSWPATAASFLDSFNVDSSASYTSTDLLSNNANTGAVVRTINDGGNGSLVVTNPTYAGGALQTSFVHNTASLAVGETAMLDVVSATQVNLESIGLIVSRENPITTSVAPGGGDGRTGKDFATAGLRFFNSTFQSERFGAGSTGQLGSAALDFGQVSGVYVQRLAQDTFALGYVDTEGGLHRVGNYDSPNFTAAGAFVGVYSDIRSSGYTATVDNLEIASVDTPVLTIDRQTGAATLSKFGPNNYAILGYQFSSLTAGSFDQTGWTSISDRYDKTSTGGAGPVDFNDDWTKLTVSGDATDLSEFNFSTTPGDPGVLSTASPISLGPVWLRTPYEDVTAKLSLDDQVIDVPVVYSGLEIPMGDLTGDAQITAADYASFLAGKTASFSNLSPAEAYLKGDLDGDLDNDIFDFVLFEQAYDAANGAGAFAAMSTAVPEPSTIVLWTLGALGIAVTRRIRTSYSACLMVTTAVAAMLASVTASAVPFTDPFDTDTSANYSQRVVLGRSGSVLPTMNYTGGTLQLTSIGSGGVPTQSLTLHNSATLGIGETLVVDVDLLSATYGSNSSEMIGLAVSAGIMNGLSLPSSSSSNVDVRDDEYSFLFGGFRNQGGRDIFRSDGYTAVGGGSITEQNVDQGVSASNTDTNLNKIDSIYIYRGETNSYELGWIDDQAASHLVRTVSMDLGANPYVGLFTDTRNASFSQTLDNLRINPVEPRTLNLLVDPSNGLMRIENPTSAAISLDAYQITSSLGNLDHVAWSSLYEQNLAGFPAGATPTDPNGWVESPGSGSGELSEYFLNDETVGPSSLATSSAINLGAAYNGAGQMDDLAFFYHDILTGQVVEGTIAFGSISPPTIPGDYDRNGIVNASDYTLWKSTFGANVSAAGDGADGNHDGVVNLADYTVWRDNLGASSVGLAQQQVAVPEPATLLLLASCGVALPLRRRLRGWLGLCGLAPAMLAAGLATATTHSDRDYRLGDDPFEGAMANTTVTLDGSNLATYDSAGQSGAGNYQDLDTIGGDPTYVNVSSRPFAGSSTLGIAFDGNDYLARTDDLLSHFGGLGNPGNNPPQNPYDNYAGITTRGIQLWVKPSSAGAGQRQDVVNDTYQFGVHITAANTWSMTWGSASGSTTGIDVDSTAPVAFDAWTHVMQHSFGNDGAVLYVNGVAVTQSGLGSSRTYRSHASGANLDLTLGVGLDKASNFFTGTLDDVDIYVAGNNTGVPPVTASITQPGMDYGTFNLATDNEFIASTLSGFDVGDVNLSGGVGPDDVSMFIANWNYTKVVDGVVIGDLESRMHGDLDFSGRVDITDALILHRRLLGLGQPGLDFSLLQGSSVPEPATGAAALLLVGLVVASRRRVES